MEKNPLREIALENGPGETLTKLSRLFSWKKINRPWIPFCGRYQSTFVLGAPDYSEIAQKCLCIIHATQNNSRNKQTKRQQTNKQTIEKKSPPPKKGDDIVSAAMPFGNVWCQRVIWKCANVVYALRAKMKPTNKQMQQLIGKCNNIHMSECTHAPRHYTHVRCCNPFVWFHNLLETFHWF